MVFGGTLALGLIEQHYFPAHRTVIGWRIEHGKFYMNEHLDYRRAKNAC